MLFFLAKNNIIVQEYFDYRKSMVEEWRASGENPFPHKFHVSMSLEDFRDKYDSLQAEEHLNDVEVSLAGKKRLWLFLTVLLLINILMGLKQRHAK